MQYKKWIWFLALCLTLEMASPCALQAEEPEGAARTEATAAPETRPETVPETKPETPAETATSTEAGTTAGAGPGAASEAEEEPSAAAGSEVSGGADTEAPAESEGAVESAREDAGLPGESQGAAESSPEDSSGTETIPDEETDEFDAFDESAEEVKAEDNQALITLRKVTTPELTHMDYEFRFLWDRDAPAGLLKPGAEVHEEKSEKSRAVGRSLFGSVVYILADSGEDWVYVESGRVRGFVKGADLSPLSNPSAAASQGISDDCGIMDVVALVLPMYNQALEYTRTTACDPVVQNPAPAIAAEERVDIYDRRDIDSHDALVVGTMKEGDLAYVLADSDRSVVYVESGDVRGFAELSGFTTGGEARKILERTGVAAMETALPRVAPRSNPALYYTLTSVKEASREAILRYRMVDLAVEYKEGKYVWGGKHLREDGGVDCSGFTQEIYRLCGLKIPRSSQGQSLYGVPVPVEDALPGDIIAYAKEGVVYHVALYIGEEMTVQARDAKRGIQVCEVGDNAVWACRIIGTEYEKEY